MAKTYVVKGINAQSVYDGKIFGRYSQRTIVDEIFAKFVRLSKGGATGADLLTPLWKSRD
jgi:hypothetical protein